MQNNLTESKPRIHFWPKKARGKLSEDDSFVLTTLEQLQSDLAHVHHSLNTVTDPILIDGYIFEMNAIHMKYQFYMKLCKERGLIAQHF